MPNLKKCFFISPPFGNYIDLPNTYQIKGSFTLDARPGFWSQVIKTVRYSDTHGGWVNKIGLRNIGIVEGLKKIKCDKDIMSIAILDKNEVEKIYKIIPSDLDIEVNISCPNVDDKPTLLDLHHFTDTNRKWCILKIGPLDTPEIIDYYYNQGFRQFHMCNTLPSDNGGISGPILIPYTNKLIEYIRNKYPESIIIAGGGITNVNDAKNYINRGANYVSVSSLCFDPVKFIIFYYHMLKLLL